MRKLCKKIIIYGLLITIISLCINISSGLCDSASDKAYENLRDNPSEENLIAFANLEFGEPIEYTSTSQLPKGKTGISLLYEHKKYGSILLIVSKKYGNIYWEYDESSEMMACAAFCFAGQLYDYVSYINGKNGNSIQGAGSELSAEMMFSLYFDILDSKYK